MKKINAYDSESINRDMMMVFYVGLGIGVAIGAVVGAGGGILFTLQTLT